MSKPKTPPQSQESKELERRQRIELDNITRRNNAQLKAIKRGRQGKRTILNQFGMAEPKTSAAAIPRNQRRNLPRAASVASILGGGGL